MTTPYKTKLVNGQEIVIRPITIKDAHARHQFFVELSMAQVGIVHNVDEIDFHTSESLEHITAFLRNKRGLWLVACSKDETVLAEVDITQKNFERVRHNGQLTIGVHPAWQNLGLGQIMLEQALLWAVHHGLKRVEVSVFASNTKAQKLYEKFNFVVEGRRQNFLRHQNGTFEDDIMMAKYF